MSCVKNNIIDCEALVLAKLTLWLQCHQCNGAALQARRWYVLCEASAQFAFYNMEDREGTDMEIMKHLYSEIYSVLCQRTDVSCFEISIRGSRSEATIGGDRVDLRQHRRCQIWLGSFAEDVDGRFEKLHDRNDRDEVFVGRLVTQSVVKDKAGEWYLVRCDFPQLKSPRKRALTDEKL